MRLSRSRTIETVVLVCLVFVVGCDEQEARPDYVARVGDRYLPEEEVNRAFENLPSSQDTAEARAQIIEQWVTNEVLHEEALRRGIQEEEDVRRMLEESRRSVLVNALVARMYDENDVTPSAAELQSYYERHKEQLRLREDFVRLRYLETATRSQAEEARRLLQQADLSARDSVFAVVVDRLASNGAFARQVSSSYHPESRLFGGKPPLQDVLGRLSDGQTAPLVELDSTFHVVQLAERVPSGTIPEPEWIEEELTRRLIIQSRKQLYVRQVQRLRNEALAREDLEVK